MAIAAQARTYRHWPVARRMRKLEGMRAAPGSRGFASLLHPLHRRALAAAGSAVLVAGAAYCLGYEGLQGGAGRWPPSLLWSACAVLPWFGLFEIAKRRTWAAHDIGLALCATAIVSVVLEFGFDRLLGLHSSPVGLQLLRRLPAIAATLLLVLLVRRDRARPAAAPLDDLSRHAAITHWIKAADNYLELHMPGRVIMVRATMHEAEALLSPVGFARIHRSLIVNRAHLATVSVREVCLMDGTRLPLGHAYAGNIRHLATNALNHTA